MIGDILMIIGQFTLGLMVLFLILVLMLIPFVDNAHPDFWPQNLKEIEKTKFEYQYGLTPSDINCNWLHSSFHSSSIKFSGNVFMTFDMEIVEDINESLPNTLKPEEDPWHPDYKGSEI